MLKYLFIIIVLFIIVYLVLSKRKNRVDDKKDIIDNSNMFDYVDKFVMSYNNNPNVISHIVNGQIQKYKEIKCDILPEEFDKQYINTVNGYADSYKVLFNNFENKHFDNIIAEYDIVHKTRLSLSFYSKEIDDAIINTLKINQKPQQVFEDEDLISVNNEPIQQIFEVEDNTDFQQEEY